MISDGQTFVLAIIGMAMAAGIAKSWIRAKHGLPLERPGRRIRRQGMLEAERQVALLSNENGALKDQVIRLEERIAVLERIATDPVQRLNDEIERLR